ncbi:MULTISPECIES: molybdopterin-binding protein [Aeromicrobium]|uniref:TOBE domain-containing protein n=1 Tax=Aeromicrobium TaxID=2040 RepID=UPI0006FE4161|nr:MULTISPECIES: TOBE domain-containing protein [Aeromicrobium]KQX72365.1 MerR family transcriptional regulator [Aeromicrobium sp. Root472D3]MBD8607906.1 TOBE domain-containing protein [Aeromicrobium sp. CFBP 8757]MCL8251411.1 TOBE domain-containing protein [Aeromicrobium fastidiosum]
MSHLRISDAARFLGVSDDTVRRWISAGSLASVTDSSGRMAVDGRELASLAQQQARAATDTSGTSSSARNRFVGLVTAVRADAVMAQVELQCGPFRVVSLMSSEAVDELGLEPGSVAVAVIKSTNVIVESLEGHS